MPCYAFKGIVPAVAPGSFLHPLASLIGDVIVGTACYIGPGASLRGDLGRIVVEDGVSIQDNATVHVSGDSDTVIRRGATLAHGAVVHGCEIGENVLVGINAVVLDQARIGAESLVAALALVGHGTVVPPGSLVAGTPGRVLRRLAPDEITWRNDPDGVYRQLAGDGLQSLQEVPPLLEPEPNRARIAGYAAAIRLQQKDR